jgi:hypothetical protein
MAPRIDDPPPIIEDIAMITQTLPAHACQCRDCPGATCTCGCQAGSAANGCQCGCRSGQPCRCAGDCA